MSNWDHPRKAGRIESDQTHTGKKPRKKNITSNNEPEVLSSGVRYLFRQGSIITAKALIPIVESEVDILCRVGQAPLGAVHRRVVRQAVVAGAEAVVVAQQGPFGKILVASDIGN